MDTNTLATYYGHTEIVKFLALKVKNPNSSLPNGKTAAKIAAERNHEDILKIFEFNQAFNDTFCYTMFKDIYANRN